MKRMCIGMEKYVSHPLNKLMSQSKETFAIKCVCTTSKGHCLAVNLLTRTFPWEVPMSKNSKICEKHGFVICYSGWITKHINVTIFTKVNCHTPSPALFKTGWLHIL